MRRPGIPPGARLVLLVPYGVLFCESAVSLPRALAALTLLALEPAALELLGGSEWLLEAERVMRLLTNCSVKLATGSFSPSSSSVIIFEAGLCANAEARGVAGVGVIDQEREVAMDSISAVPDRDLLEAA